MSSRSVADHAQATAALLATISDRLDAAPPVRLPVNAPEALGRILAASVYSPIPLPSFTNSQMDGFAVSASDLEKATATHPIRLPLRPVLAAGDAPRTHVRGTASPIMTGAAVPVGADAVVPVEHARPPVFPSFTSADAEALHADPSVEFADRVSPGQFIREEGEDLAAGTCIAEAGSKLTSTRIGLIAAVGIAELPVRPRPRVLLVTTGAEVVPPGAPLRPGSVYDANAAMLASACAAEGAQVHHIHCGDDPQLLVTKLREHAATTDLLVTSGGISAGAFEVVREALSPLGVHFLKVAMQPGGPQGFGSVNFGNGARPVPALCFPGNPVSSLLSAEMFLFPWLRSLRGDPPQRSRVAIPLAAPVESPQDKLQLRRGTISEDGLLELSPPGSHLLKDFAQAEVIAEIPAGMRRIRAGTALTTWRIND